MNQKLQLTKTLLNELNVVVNEKQLKSWYLLWWLNPRDNGTNSMRLTERGLDDFEQKLGLKSYQVDFPKPIENFHNKLFLDLDRTISGPYFLTRKYIKVFAEKTAVQLVLFGGDIKKYTRSNEMSQKYNTKID